jgi:hypothetical protein
MKYLAATRSNTHEHKFKQVQTMHLQVQDVSLLAGVNGVPDPKILYWICSAPDAAPDRSKGCLALWLRRSIWPSRSKTNVKSAFYLWCEVCVINDAASTHPSIHPAQAYALFRVQTPSPSNFNPSMSVVTA